MTCNRPLFGRPGCRTDAVQCHGVAQRACRHARILVSRLYQSVESRVSLLVESRFYCLVDSSPRG
jgi:hypothetical protein